MPCEIIANTLTQTEFIAGTSQRLYFDVVDSANALVDLTTAVCTWTMSPSGDPTYVSASGLGYPVSGSTNRYYIDLIPSDTSELSGIFIQQPKIIDFLGNVFIPDQGKIVIWLNVGGQEMLNAIASHIQYYYFKIGSAKIGTSRIK